MEWTQRTLLAGLVFSFSKIFSDCCLDARAPLILSVRWMQTRPRLQNYESCRSNKRSLWRRVLLLRLVPSAGGGKGGGEGVSGGQEKGAQGETNSATN